MAFDLFVQIWAEKRSEMLLVNHENKIKTFCPKKKYFAFWCLGNVIFVSGFFLIINLPES